MGICQKTCLIEFEFALLIHIGLVHLNRFHFCKKHMVTSKFLNFCHYTFNIDRCFFNDRCVSKLLCLFRSQMTLFPFIHIPAGAHTTVISRMGELFGCQIDHKLSALFNHMIRISYRSYGNVYHRRICTYSSCPCNGKNVRISFFVCRTYHNCRKRVDHITGFPYLFRHFSFLLKTVPCYGDGSDFLFENVLGFLLLQC